MEVVYAIHNFEAENPDEIAFRIGDPITVIEKDEKFLDGWWQVIYQVFLFEDGIELKLYTTRDINFMDSRVEIRKARWACFQ
jgi:hypothetical protein